MSASRLRTVLAAVALLAVLGSRDLLAGGSDIPPAGPPWKRDFVEAQREALKDGKPIFIYLTKTY